MPSVPLQAAVTQGGFADATCFLVVALAPDAPADDPRAVGAVALDTGRDVVALAHGLIRALADIDPALAPLFLLAGVHALEAKETGQAAPATPVQ